MAVEIVTKENLLILRKQIAEDVKTILKDVLKPANEAVEGYKTSHVRKILGCSVNKIVSLRISRKLRAKKNRRYYLL